MVKKLLKSMLDGAFGDQKWYSSFFSKKQIRKEKKEAVKFFESSVAEIESNTRLLADEKSKEVYEGMIKYRKTRDEKDFPGYEGNQYFVEDIIKLSPNMTFVDCGGFDGETTLEFIKRVNGDYKKVVVFEPDKTVQGKLRENLLDKQNVVIFNKGLWDDNKKLIFRMQGNGTTTVVEVPNDSEQNENHVEVDAIDNIPECQEVSFLKMDLEGSEWRVLHGASKTIKRNQPILAICIYHSNEDMVRLQQYIYELVPKYSFYVRHHSKTTSETVLYAIPPKSII